MAQKKARYILLILLVVAARAGAQGNNSVPLDHHAYILIEMGVIRGIITPPPLAKPWPLWTVREKLWEMIDDTSRALSSQEVDSVAGVLASFDREEGRYRNTGDNYTLEMGLGWESNFSFAAPQTTAASTNTARLYFAGDAAKFKNSISWNMTVLGELLYIGRTRQGEDPRFIYDVSSTFPYTCSKQWDGGVISLSNGGYSGWPDDAALACSLEFEINVASSNRLLQLRLGRIRRDWGPEENGLSLFMNANSRPFFALEGMVAPFPWLNISFLNGATEYFREDARWPENPPFSNLLSAAQLALDPWKFLHFDIGVSAIPKGQSNTGFLSNLELRAPGLLKIWGSLFVDHLDSLSESFNYRNGNNYAYQAGIKTNIHWLPLAVFSLRYTKVEPFCYTHTYDLSNGEWIPSVNAFVNGGESLGYYMPPNSDEFLLRFESILFPEIMSHIQFQMLRHGTDFGSGAVNGSSLRDKLVNANSAKYFLMDGVYRWESVIKLGGSLKLRAAGLPFLVYVETGMAITRYTINGIAGSGNEADYETLSSEMYRAGNRFIFSAGFKLFP